MTYAATKYDTTITSYGDHKTAKTEGFNNLAHAKKWVGRYAKGIVKSKGKTVWSRL